MALWGSHGKEYSLYTPIYTAYIYIVFINPLHYVKLSLLEGGPRKGSSSLPNSSYQGEALCVRACIVDFSLESLPCIKSM